MERGRAIEPSESLKRHAAPDRRLGEIDIADAVMARIAARQPEALSGVQSGVQSAMQPRTRQPAGQSPMQPQTRQPMGQPAAVQPQARQPAEPPRARPSHLWPIRPVRPITSYASALLILLLASATVYAAGEHLLIRNRAGDVILQSSVTDSVATLKPYDPVTDRPEPTERDQVLAMIKPGQLLAYYVRDGQQQPTIQYLHDTRITSSYQDFQALLTRTSAPHLQEPTALPDGFKFQSGSVMPILPQPSERDPRMAAEYDRLLAHFQQQAAAEPERNLFVEEAKWTEANIADMEYSNDTMTLRFTAMKDMLGMEAPFSSEYTVEKLQTGDTEIIFASAVIHGYQRYEALWYDEAQRTHYQATASGTVDLTATQFKQIVQSMIAP